MVGIAALLPARVVRGEVRLAADEGVDPPWSAWLVVRRHVRRPRSRAERQSGRASRRAWAQEGSRAAAAACLKSAKAVLPFRTGNTRNRKLRCSVGGGASHTVIYTRYGFTFTAYFRALCISSLSLYLD